MANILAIRRSEISLAGALNIYTANAKYVYAGISEEAAAALGKSLGRDRVVILGGLEYAERAREIVNKIIAENGVGSAEILADINDGNELASQLVIIRCGVYVVDIVLAYVRAGAAKGHVFCIEGRDVAVRRFFNADAVVEEKARVITEDPFAYFARICQ